MDKGSEGFVGHSYGTGFLHTREKYFCIPTALCNNQVTDFSVSCFQQVWVLISRGYIVKVLYSQGLVSVLLWG